MSEAPFAPAGPVTGSNPPPPPSPPAVQDPFGRTKPAWWKRTWVVATAAGLLGIGIGGASAETPDVKTTSEYESVASALQSAEKELASAEADLAKAESEIESLAGDLPEREAAVKEAQSKAAATQKDLDRRAAAAKKAEAAVAKRERAVRIVEAEIDQNTISGDGVWAVGQDIKAGTYKTTGGSDCYYSVLNSTDTSDIATNNNITGPGILTVRDGQYLQLSGCTDWTLQP